MACTIWFNSIQLICYLLSFKGYLYVLGIFQQFMVLSLCPTTTWTWSLLISVNIIRVIIVCDVHTYSFDLIVLLYNDLCYFILPGGHTLSHINYYKSCKISFCRDKIAGVCILHVLTALISYH